jgi:hypothetical protein
MQRDALEGSPKLKTSLPGSGNSFDTAKQLMWVIIGAHHVLVEKGRWLKRPLLYCQRLCRTCTWGPTFMDEVKVLFRRHTNTVSQSVLAYIDCKHARIQQARANLSYAPQFPCQGQTVYV